MLISWVIFAFEDLKQVGAYLGAMFHSSGIPLVNAEAMYYLKNYGIILGIGILLSLPVLWKRLEKIEAKPKTGTSIGVSIFYIVILLLCTASLVSDSYNPFLYFRF